MAYIFKKFFRGSDDLMSESSLKTGLKKAIKFEFETEESMEEVFNKFDIDKMAEVDFNNFSKALVGEVKINIPAIIRKIKQQLNTDDEDDENQI